MDGATTQSPLTTVTHARLRALQGDVTAARRILTAILERTPEDAEARTLLADLAGRHGRPHAADLDETPLEPPEPANAREMAARFKRALGGSRERPRRVVRNLEQWLERVQRNAGPDGVRG